MPSHSALLYDLEGMSVRDEESGYASASSSDESISDVFFTKSHLTFLNRQLQNLEPPGKMNSSSSLGVARELIPPYQRSCDGVSPLSHRFIRLPHSVLQDS